MYELYTNNYKEDTPDYGATVNTGKVFELTETFTSYFIQALMFQDRFFDASASTVGSKQYSSMAVELVADAIATSNFSKVLGEVLRQLILTGNSGMTLNVRDKKLMFECLDIFRTYLLPRHSTEFPNFIYEYSLTEPELYEFFMSSSDIKETNFDKFKERVVITTTSADVADDYNNINKDSQGNVNHLLWELLAHYYYCYQSNKYKVCWYTSAGEKLYEKVIKQEYVPIVIQSITLPNSPYGFSPLESSVGLIAELTALKSYRLTAAKVSSWYMFTSDDGMIPDDLTFEPNRVFRTSKPNALLPLSFPANGYEVNAAEEASLNSNIYTNVGLGSGVSANVSRQAERVTATEIDALQKASGTRLNLLFSLLEASLFSPIINYAKVMLSTLAGSKTIKVYNNDSDSHDIYSADWSLLKDFDMVLDVSKVKERLESVQKLIDFVSAVGNIPAAQEVVNFKNIIMDIANLYGFPEPQRYIIQPEKPKPQEDSQDATSDIYQKALSSPQGINPEDNRILNSIQQGMQSDPSIAATMAGNDPNDPSTFADTEESLIQQQLASMNQTQSEGMFVK